jgi:hypothetical protein
MSPRPFEPKFMKLSVLTAALQERTPRSVRACMFALQHDVPPAQGMPVQGRGRVAYWS